MLPHLLPQTPHFEIQALTRPCRTVGGDYYEVVTVPGDRYGLSVADVCGKGLPDATRILFPPVGHGLTVVVPYAARGRCSEGRYGGLDNCNQS